MIFHASIVLHGFTAPDGRVAEGIEGYRDNAIRHGEGRQPMGSETKFPIRCSDIDAIL